MNQNYAIPVSPFAPRNTIGQHFTTPTMPVGMREMQVPQEESPPDPPANVINAKTFRRNVCDFLASLEILQSLVDCTDVSTGNNSHQPFNPDSFPAFGEFRLEGTINYKSFRAGSVKSKTRRDNGSITESSNGSILHYNSMSSMSSMSSKIALGMRKSSIDRELYYFEQPFEHFKVLNVDWRDYHRRNLQDIEYFRSIAMDINNLRLVIESSQMSNDWHSDRKWLTIQAAFYLYVFMTLMVHLLSVCSRDTPFLGEAFAFVDLIVLFTGFEKQGLRFFPLPNGVQVPLYFTQSLDVKSVLETSNSRLMLGAASDRIKQTIIDSWNYSGVKQAFDLEGDPQQQITAIQGAVLEILDRLERHTLPGLERCKMLREGTREKLNGLIHRHRRVVQSRLLRICIVGIMKAGKSTFINSLLGEDLAPMNVDAATAVPLLIRNASYITAPRLEFNANRFNAALRELRSLNLTERYGRSQHSPQINSFILRSNADPALSTSPTSPTSSTVLMPGLNDIDLDSWDKASRYKALNQEARSMLAAFDSGNPRYFVGVVEGAEECSQTVRQLNAMVRICGHFGIARGELTFGDVDDFPVVRVNFKNLWAAEDRNLDDLFGDFELVDMPGVDEAIDFGIMHSTKSILASAGCCMVVLNAEVLGGKAEQDVFELVHSFRFSANDTYIIVNKMDQHKLQNATEEENFRKVIAYQYLGSETMQHKIFLVKALLGRISMKFRKDLRQAGDDEDTFERPPIDWQNSENDYRLDWAQTAYGFDPEEEYEEASREELIERNEEILRSSSIANVIDLVRNHLARNAVLTAFHSGLENLCSDLHIVAENSQAIYDALTVELDDIQGKTLKYKARVTELDEQLRHLHTGPYSFVKSFLRDIENDFKSIKKPLVAYIRGERYYLARMRSHLNIRVERFGELSSALAFARLVFASIAQKMVSELSQLEDKILKNLYRHYTRTDLTLLRRVLAPRKVRDFLRFDYEEEIMQQVNTRSEELLVTKTNNVMSMLSMGSSNSIGSERRYQISCKEVERLFVKMSERILDVTLKRLYAELVTNISEYAAGVLEQKAKVLEQMTIIETRRRRNSISAESTADAVLCKMDLESILCSLEQIKGICSGTGRLRATECKI